MSHRDRPFGSYDLLVFGIALLGLLDVTHLAVQQQLGFEGGCFGDPSFGAAVRAEPAVGAGPGAPAIPAATGPAAGANLVSAATSPADCGSVVESEAGTFLGLSNIGWGFLFYGALAVLSLVRGTRTWRRKLLGTLRELLVVVGFGYTIFLVYVQLFVLEQICTLCMLSAGLVTVLFALIGWAVWTEDADTQDGAREAILGGGEGTDPLRWYITATAVWVVLVAADVQVFGGGFATFIP